MSVLLVCKTNFSVAKQTHFFVEAHVHVRILEIKYCIEGLKEPFTYPLQGYSLALLLSYLSLILVVLSRVWEESYDIIFSWLVLMTPYD